MRVLVVAIVIALGCSDSATVDLERSTVMLDVTTGLVANGVDAATLRVTLRDAGGHPISDRAVDVISPDEVTIGFVPKTDARGVTDVLLTATVAGTKQINVIVDDLTFETITVEFAPGPTSELVFLDLVGPGMVNASLPAFRVAYVDANHNIVTAQTGTITVTLLPDTARASLAGTSSVMATDGIATFDNVAITTAGAGLVLQASSATTPTRDSEPFDIVVGEPSATLSTFVASPVAIEADGVEEAELVVTLRNAGGIAIPNYPVTFAATGAGIAFYPLMSGLTDAQGQLRTKLSSSAAGVSNVTATAGVRIFPATVTFEASCLPQLPSGPSTLVGAPASSMVIGDFTGDGTHDAVVAHQVAGTDFVSVMRGAGNGRFHAAVTYLLGEDSGGLSHGDLDADGDLDLVVAGSFGKQLYVLLNEGPGTFVAGTPLAFPQSVFDVEVVDFNGDTKLDLITRGDYIVTTLVGNGDGTFQTGFAYTLDVSQFSDPSATIVVAQIDGDATLDIFTIGNNAYSVLLGNANGTFSMLASVDGAGAAGKPGLADLDNDNNLDVVNGLLVYYGKGNGTFEDAVNLGPPLVYGVTTRAVDFDLDGNVDLIAAVSMPSMREVWLYTGAGTRTFDVTPLKITLGRGVHELAVADFDGDFDQDVLVLQSSDPSALVVLHGLASVGVRGGARRYGEAVGSERAYFWPVVGNFDAGTLLDFVASNLVTGNLGVQLRGALGTLTAMTTHAIASVADVVTGDFDGDSKEDVLVLGGGLSWLRGDGSGQLQASAVSAMPTSGTSLRVAMLDAGGTADVVYVDPVASTVVVAFGTGAGTWIDAVQLPVATLPVAVEVADLDADGDRDLVVASRSGKAVTVFENNAGVFTAKPGLASNGNPSAIAIGDIDGDGALDIVAGDHTALSVGYFRGNGDGTFAGEVRVTTGVRTYRVELRDLDDDGELDLLSSSAGLWVLRGGIGATFKPPLLYDTGFFRSTFVDVTGDARLDILGTHLDATAPAMTIATARACE